MNEKQAAFLRAIAELAKHLELPPLDSMHVFGYIAGGLAISQIVHNNLPDEATFQQYLSAFGDGFEVSSGKLDKLRQRHAAKH
jgi:hypothetical protein